MQTPVLETEEGAESERMNVCLKSLALLLGIVVLVLLGSSSWTIALAVLNFSLLIIFSCTTLRFDYISVPFRNRDF
jgi:hypothetical protein